MSGVSNKTVVAAFVAAVFVFVGAAVAATKAAQSGPPSPSSEPLPALTVFRNGQPLPLAGKRDKPALLHLWATWCGPCRDELPLILDYGRSGDVEVIAVSVDDDYQAVVDYFGANPMGAPAADGLRAGNIPKEVAWDKNIVVERAMGVNSLPTTIVLDTNGGVRGTLTGAQDWRDPGLRQAVARILR